MAALTMTVNDRQQMFGAGLVARLNRFLAAEQQARRQAARLATLDTRSNFHRTRDVIAPRPKRESTGGQMTNKLRWVARNGMVEFDIEQADAEAPHWIIQEIGTGQRATIKRANDPNPSGRPASGATYIRTVKSQKGRRISGGLVFASGGMYSPPGSRRDEQLHWASAVRGVPQWHGLRGAHHASGRPGGQASAIRIHNEIHGQHFVQKGGEAGFREYQTSVLAAARQAFQKSIQP